MSLNPLWLILPAIHLCGLMAGVHAIFTSRTPEGAIAWATALFTFPYLTLPFYLVFGRDHFNGYVHALRSGTFRNKDQEIAEIHEKIREHEHRPHPEQEPTLKVLQKLARIPFTGACSVELLINGRATYSRIIEEIDKAVSYVLVLFFIVNDDDAGRALRDAMIRRAQQGVRVYFIYDEMGSQYLTQEFLDLLTQAGVKVTGFRTTRGWRNRFQINFRNHRKIVVVDGRVGLTGGMNVGNESLGKSPWYGPWRDTHLVVSGPAVLGMQLVFLEDWHWATGGELPEVQWEPWCHPDGSMAATYLSSGPADLSDVGILFFLQCITAARTRLWIQSPYFIPDPIIMEALNLASLRGVDVRVIIPPGRFEPHMRLAALAFLPQVAQTENIKVYRYPDYNHSKCMLVDDWMGWVGSSNLDNRSLRLNFEGNMVVVGEKFVADLEAMFEADFARSRQLDLKKTPNLLNQLGSKIARLFVPIL